MNAYEKKQQERKDRYLELADKANSGSQAASLHSHRMAQAIPFGQPVLVGHHSEKSDRAYRAKIGGSMDKAVELAKKADYYERKAESVGKGGVSSDDPDAIEKLQKQLDKAVETQELMKAANKVLRKHKEPEAQKAALIAQGFREDVAAEIVSPAHGQAGFASYQLTNNNANIRRIKGRIEQLEKLANRESVEVVGNGFVCREDAEENRVMFIFEGKPDEAIRAVLKKHAFKWSPTRGAWVRHLNGSGIFAARCVIQQLNP